MRTTRFPFAFRLLVCHAPDDGGGAAAAGETAAAADAAATAGASDAAADAAGNAGASGAAPAGDAAYRPEGLAEELIGATDRETVDKLAARLAEVTATGEDKDYVGAFDGDHAEALNAAFGNADDPLYAGARAAAIKHGIPPAAFKGFLADVFGPAFAGGVLPPPFSPEREIAAFGEAIGATDKAAQAKAHGERVAFAQGLGQQMGLSAAEQVELDVLTDTAGGLKLLDRLRDFLASDGVKVASAGGSAAAGDLSKAELARLDSDPRIDPRSPTYDRELRARYDRAYRRHFA